MKRFFALILILALCASLYACSADKATESTATIASQKQTEQTEPITTLSTIPETTAPATEAPTEPPIAVEPIQKSETVTIPDICEFSIDEIDWSYDLSADVSYGILHIAEASDNSILCYLKMNYKNLSPENFNFATYFNDWDVKLTYDGKYKYDNLKISDTFSNSNTGLQPLQSGDLYIVFELPEEFKHDGKELIVNIEMYDHVYCLTLREPGNAQGNNPELIEGEKQIVEGHCEITLTDLSYNTKLMPPDPGSFSTYYNAPDGSHFLIAEFVLKNLSNNEIFSDVLVGTVNIGGHSIDGYCSVADSSGGYLGSFSLASMSECTAYFYAPIPDDLIGMDATMEIKFAGEKWTIHVPSSLTQ